MYSAATFYINNIRILEITSPLSYVHIDSQYWPVYLHKHSILAVFYYHKLYFDVRPASWSEPLTNNLEVPGSIPGSTVGIFLGGEDSRGDNGLGRLVEFRFKAPPGTTSSSITTHTSSEKRNCASWASQPQKSVTLLPCSGGRTTKSTKDMWWHWSEKYCDVKTP